MIEFSVKMSDETEKFFKKLARKLDDPRTMLAKAGQVMLRSIDQNFRVQGRPRRWEPLSPLTKALRRKGTGTRRFAILQDKGRLKGSMSARVYFKKVSIGTNLEKAPLLHHGGMTKGSEIRIPEHTRRITKAFGKSIRPKHVRVRSYTMKIGPKRVPPRPFVMFQREDLQAIEKLGLKHIEESAK